MVLESNLHEFLRRLPKCELHIHIEGTLEPELLFELAARNHLNIDHADSVEHLRSLYEFDNLQSFLDLYYMGVSCLRTEQDYYDLTMAYMKRVHADRCRHVEIFFDPQSHTTRGIALETVIRGMKRALDEASSRLGVSSYLIMCFLRHLSEDDALQVLEEARPFLVSTLQYAQSIFLSFKNQLINKLFKRRISRELAWTRLN